jgi:hypothetical protein
MDSGGMSESDIRFINMRQKDALYDENAALRTQLAAALTEGEALRAQVAEATTKCPHCGVGFLQAGEMQRVLDGVKDIRADYIRLVQEQATYYEHAKAKERETITVSRALAAGQAREVELREELTNVSITCENCGPDAAKVLSAPTDTAALRAMLRAAWIDGIDGDDGSNSADAYIDRVLGGS